MNQSDDNESITPIGDRRRGQLAPRLKATHEPEKDLWPMIEHGIQSSQVKQPAFQWMPYALAASLLVSILSISLSGYLYVNQQELTAQINIEPATVSNLELIEKPYIIAKTTYLTEIATDHRQLTPELKEVLRNNLEIIETAASEIHAALKANPNDAFLMDTLIQTREKEIELLRQVTSQPATTI